MLELTLRGLVAHKRRLLTTALAVTLGVAFMAGTLVLTDTIGKTFDTLFSNVYRNTDTVVRAKTAFAGPQNSGDQRGRIDAALLTRVEKVQGVKLAEGDVFGFARLVGKDGQALGRPELGVPTVGAAWPRSPELNPWRVVAGRPPAADDEVVIDKKSADDGDLTVGSVTTVLTQSGPHQVRIAGVATFGGADSPGGASFTIFEAGVAPALVAQPGKLDSISLVAQPGVSEKELARRVQAVLPAGTEAVTGTAITQETQRAIHKAFSFFNTFMLVFAVVALIVGAFMIFNTFSITVAQRTRENGLLRALGASRSQVFTSVVLEALAIGVLASMVGLGLGVLVAGGLKSLLAAMGFDIPTGSVVFQGRTVVVSVLAGVVVTLVAAVSPARKAAKVAPVTAMQSAVTTSMGYGSKQRVLVGLLVLAAGAGTLLVGLFGHVSSPAMVVGIGVVAVFFGVSVLGRTVSLPLSRALGAPVARLRGTTGELARDNAMRNPKRTAASASALMIGVGLVGFITILAASTKTSINAALDRQFTGDFVILSGATPGMGGGVDPGLTSRLNQLPEVGSASGIRTGYALVAGKVKKVTGLDPATGFAILDTRPLQGRPEDLGPGTVAVFKDVATDQNIKVGDTLTAFFKDSGQHQVRVAMIYGEDIDQPSGAYLMPMSTYQANFADQFDSRVFITRAPGVSTGTALSAVKGVAKDYPGAKVFDRAGYKADQGKQVNQMLSLVYALLALAIVIALLGIGNTLALAILERTRELGLLRAVGMTRRQLRSTIRWESVIIALQGTVLGLVIGVFFGWALVRALNSQGIDHFMLPVGQLMTVVVLAGLAGVVAAIAPSRRAAKLNVLEAIAHE